MASSQVILILSSVLVYFSRNCQELLKMQKDLVVRMLCAGLRQTNGMRDGICDICSHNSRCWLSTLKGLAMIFAGQENPYIIFRSKEIYIYFKRNNKLPINLLK